MKVSELVSLLAKVPQDAKVLMEGCDCYQDPYGLIIHDDGDILISNDNTGLSKEREPKLLRLTRVNDKPTYIPYEGVN